ncbi:MAG: hypothetical protein IJ250_07055 [Bacteroidales bacterium]|nr:hypothetical protein [Bacteroidales bacterium]
MPNDALASKKKWFFTLKKVVFSLKKPLFSALKRRSAKIKCGKAKIKPRSAEIFNSFSVLKRSEKIFKFILLFSQCTLTVGVRSPGR